MTAQEQRYFEMLTLGPCVPFQYVTDFYGLPWPLPEDVRPDYDAWMSRLRRRHACAQGSISRYELESFMQQKKVVPKKWMGARLGMKVSSLEELLSRLNEIGMRDQRYVVYSELISEALADDIVPNLPSLKFRTFSDHNSFCLRLQGTSRPLGWYGKKQLGYANIQTIRASCDLDDYYLADEAEAIYLRLDFDYKTLGDPFSHPLAHIHIEGDLSPRFALDGGTSGNIVVDYLEFLYRDYAPETWLQWVQREWAKQFESATPDAIDPLPIIVAAFTSSQFQILRDYSNHIDRIKQFLRKKKDELFDLHINGDERVILGIPWRDEGA